MSITSVTEQPLVIGEFQRPVGNKIECSLCPHLCKLQEGETGICGGRQVIDNRIIATNYGMISSLNLDPIEKKPFYHYFPGGEILSVGPNGCNLTCKWCLNWQISQSKEGLPTRILLPEDLADMVDALDGIGVAYTYAEPLIWFEFVRDAGRILHERDLVNILISNGYVTEEPLRQILPFVDAFNVDLKVVDSKCYQSFCGGRLEDVERSIKMIYDAGKHLEITHLLVTNVSTDMNRFEKLVRWISSLDKTIPLHLSRYFPAHNFEEPATDLAFMKQALEFAKSELDWVYMGNVWTGEGENSVCSCGEILIERNAGDVQIVGLDGNKCRKCGKTLNFVVEA